jgi:hypothetical protein
MVFTDAPLPETLGVLGGVAGRQRIDVGGATAWERPPFCTRRV